MADPMNQMQQNDKSLQSDLNEVKESKIIRPQLYLAMFDRYKAIEKQNQQLRNKLLPQSKIAQTQYEKYPLGKQSQFIDKSSIFMSKIYQGSEYKSIDDITKSLNLNRQHRARQYQRLTEELKQNNMQKLTKCKASMDNERILTLQTMLGKQKEQKEKLQTEINKLQKQKNKNNEIAVDKKQLQVVKQLLAQTKKSLTQISKKYEQDQLNFRANINQLTKVNDQSLKEYDRVNNQLQKQNQLYRQQCKNNSGNQKKIILDAAISSLNIFTKIKSLQKEIPSKQFINGLQALQRLVQDSQEGQKFVQIINSKQLERKYGKLIDLIVGQLKELRQNKSSLQNEMKDKVSSFNYQLNSQKNELSKIKLQLGDKSKQLKAKQDIIFAQNDQIKTINSEKQSITDNLQRQKRSLQQQKRKNQQLQKSYIELEKKNNLIQAEKTNKIRDISNLMTQKIQLQKTMQNQIIKLKKEKEQLQNQRKRLNAEILRLNNLITSQSREIQRLKKQIQRLQKLLLEKESIIRTQVGNYTQLQKSKTQLQNTIVLLQQQKRKLQDKINKLQLQLSPLKSQIAVQASDISKKNRQITDLTNDYNEAQRSLAESQSTVRMLSRYEDAFNSVNQSLICQLSYFIAKQKLYVDIENSKQSLQIVLQKFKGYFSQAKYFGDSEIIQRQKIDFLISEIRTFTRNIVYQTKLIYRFDLKNPTNFHAYIDGKENILVLVKLINNITIGGFSSMPLLRVDKNKQSSKQLGKGIIFSLTREQSFPVKRDAKMSALTYDDFFFIFGNSQIRMRVQQKKIYSNFGVGAGIFDNGTFARNQFLGVNDLNITEMQLVSYQFYQITFKM